MPPARLRDSLVSSEDDGVKSSVVVMKLIAPGASPVFAADKVSGRLMISSLWLGGGLLFFGITQRLPRTLGSSESNLDYYVPFVAEFVVVYLLFFVGVPLAAAAQCRVHFQATLRSSLFAVVVALAIYVIWPTAHAQQPVESIGSDWIAAVYRAVYRIDNCSNCFPSLHVAISVIVARGLGVCQSRYAVVTWCFAVGIVASTLLSKQHYVLDVGGGVALAGMSLRVCRPRKVDRVVRGGFY